MNIVIDFFKTPGDAKENFRIRNIQQLTGKEASVIREEIIQLMDSGVETIYLDASKAAHADLSGINEVIHTSYIMQQAARQLVFVYRKNSEVEKWVTNTGLDKFVPTAILPA